MGSCYSSASHNLSPLSEKTLPLSLLQVKVDSLCKTPPPPPSTVALAPDKLHHTPTEASFNDLRPRKPRVNFKSPLTSPSLKAYSPCPSQAKDKHRKKFNLLSHVHKTFLRRKEKFRHFDENNKEKVLKKVPNDVKGKFVKLVF